MIERKLEALRHCVARVRAKRPPTAAALAGDADLQDVLAEAGLIGTDWAARLRSAVGFRNIAVHNSEAIDWGIVWLCPPVTRWATSRHWPGQVPWTELRDPVSMRHLSEAVRTKAIAIANSLLAEGLDEGLAIRIAIAKTEQRARRRGLPERDDQR